MSWREPPEEYPLGELLSCLSWLAQYLESRSRSWCPPQSRPPRTRFEGSGVHQQDNHFSLALSRHFDH
jgi:hypothetical protein